MSAVLYAHQGGWDEILLVISSLALIGALFVFAHRRANALARERQQTPTDDGGR